MGLEPTTTCLGSRDSTTELRPLKTWLIVAWLYRAIQGKKTEQTNGLNTKGRTIDCFGRRLRFVLKGIIYLSRILGRDV